MTSRVLVLGATGLLGSSVVPVLRSVGYCVLAHGRSGGVDFAVDLRDRDQVFRLIKSTRPNVIVNLVALTDIDRCEGDHHAAYSLNTAVVTHLVDGLKLLQADCYLVQLSTDMVYDGVGPHEERDVTVRNVYALSKIAGECAALAWPSAVVVRTNFFGQSKCASRTSFTDWIFREVMGGGQVPVFEDVLFSPLSIETLSSIMSTLIKERPLGVFNLGSRSGMSKADFAEEFVRCVGLPCGQLRRVRMVNSGLKAARSLDMRMNSHAIERTLSISLPETVDEIIKSGVSYDAKTRPHSENW